MATSRTRPDRTVGMMRAGRLPAGFTVVLAVVTVAVLTSAGTASAATSEGAGHPAAGSRARPGTSPAPLSLTETWSTALPDSGNPIAFSSPIPADLDGQESVVVGDRTGNVYAFNLGTPT